MFTYACACACFLWGLLSTPVHASIPRRQAALLRGAEAGNLTVLDKTFHAFSPHGVTGMLVSYSEASQC